MFDWPFILYAGKAWLHYSDAEVWRLTPRSFNAQVRVYLEVEKAKWGGGNKSNSQDGFIDKIPGW